MKAKISLLKADADIFLRTLDTGSVDLIVTDPAYESLEKHRARGTTTRLTGSWFPIYENRRFGVFFEECYRVLKKNAHLYVFCDQETMFHLKPLGEAAGFKFWKPIVWDKVHMGMGYHYRAQAEFILFFEKGKRRLHNLGVPDVLSVERIRNRYPTQKPDALLETLVSQSSSPGELVVDPFFGSGGVAVACKKLGRNFAGSDISPGALDCANVRLGRWR